MPMNQITSWSCGLDCFKMAYKGEAQLNIKTISPEIMDSLVWTYDTAYMLSIA